MGREQDIVGTDLLKVPRTIRRQHCSICDTVLAREISDKIGFAAHSQYEWIDRGIWRQGRWFGNKVICPTCGAELVLPADKPLSYEAMMNRRKEKEDKLGNSNKKTEA